MRGLPQKYISPWSSVSACASAYVFKSPAALTNFTICVLLVWRQASKQYIAGLAGAHPTAAYNLVAGAACTGPPKGRYLRTAAGMLPRCVSERT